MRQNASPVSQVEGAGTVRRHSSLVAAADGGDGMANEVEKLVAALTAWEAAQEPWREACEGEVTEEAVQAYEQAREAWLDAQCSVPEEQAHATLLEALRVHHCRQSR